MSKAVGTYITIRVEAFRVFNAFRKVERGLILAGTPENYIARSYVELSSDEVLAWRKVNSAFFILSVVDCRSNSFGVISQAITLCTKVGDGGDNFWVGDGFFIGGVAGITPVRERTSRLYVKYGMLLLVLDIKKYILKR